MAKIVFLSLYDVNAEGLRTLSSILKQHGHQPFIIFLKKYSRQRPVSGEPDDNDWIGINMQGRPFGHAIGKEISDQEKAICLQLIKRIEPDWIGMSVTTPLRQMSSELTRLIKKTFDLPIIWGGPAPTTEPERCAQDCDYVCIGEGERPVVELARHCDLGKSIASVPNMAYLGPNGLVKNPMFPLVEDLNTLPFKDIHPQDKFLIAKGKLIENFSEVSYSRSLKYHIISSRGCPYSCSYCCENHYKNLYMPQVFLRRRSPSHVIEELKEAKGQLDCRIVQFEDEIFARDLAWLEEFATLYRNEIKLPFICYLFPDKDIVRRIQILKEAGLILTCLGLQSGSQKTNREIYHRPYNRELMMKTAAALRTLKIEYYVDVITHNPLETEEDLKATLDALLELPKPYWLCLNKLSVIKGTDISSLMTPEIKEWAKQKDVQQLFDYYSRLYWLAPFTGIHKHTAAALQKIKFFRRNPHFINPLLLNLPFYSLYYAKKGSKRIKHLFRSGT
ncbi:B12-binding domain-containing radical SAM protein [Acidobacteriota bacterium]